MKISALKYNSYLNTINKTNNVNFGKTSTAIYKKKKDGIIPLYSSNNETIVQIKKAEAEKHYKRFLTQKGHVSTKEYDDIVNNHSATLVKATKDVEREYKGSITPLELAKIAKSIDMYLKDKYKNFRISYCFFL